MPLLPKTPRISRRALPRGLGGSAGLGALADRGVPAAYVAPGHQPTGRDLIVISDWMCGRFVRLGWVQEVDRSRQPNVTEYLDPLLRSRRLTGATAARPW
ncbi:hypothetical protein B1H29_10420 [Streptomyces pactum]|uniref:Uncharacterized protein n=1 Tax=Streptomyces pactum TaxID=68249 RepID=A0A1S6J6B7_9ACTN|nr:hypothetical protein B1H29_10420 [Streptomyces pactum]